MNETGTLVAFVIAIAMSLSGGLLLGYFYGRIQNGYRDEIDALRGEIGSLNHRIDGLADTAQNLSLRVGLVATESRPPEPPPSADHPAGGAA